jgi:ribosomal protein S18 acetylase RimI-like enzyme
MAIAKAFPLIGEYWLRSGEDWRWLVKFMQQTYQERSPEQDFSHLSQTVRQYLTEQTPFWLVEKSVPDNQRSLEPLGCLWLGNAIDQVTGDRYTHILLLYVEPAHRCQGIGSALIVYAENWAQQRGDRQIGLQVFCDNHGGLNLYQSLGYQAQSLSMLKPITQLEGL